MLSKFAGLIYTPLLRARNQGLLIVPRCKTSILRIWKTLLMQKRNLVTCGYPTSRSTGSISRKIKVHTRIARSLAMDSLSSPDCAVLLIRA